MSTKTIIILRSISKHWKTDIVEKMHLDWKSAELEVATCELKIIRALRDQVRLVVTVWAVPTRLTAAN